MTVGPVSLASPGPRLDAGGGTSDATGHFIRLVPTILALGVTSVTLGLLWDISWHATIGRDTFWTPAHVAVYLGGLVVGGVALALGARATLGPGKAPAVRLGPTAAPAGAWIAGWGCLGMLTAAGFDDWWHDAYGLDVGILTPAHSLLGLGMVAVHAGALALAVAAHNRRQASPWPGVWIAGVMLLLLNTLLMEFNYANLQHGTRFYLVSCASYPVVLAAAARGLSPAWSATRVAAVYTILNLGMLWLLPLFPARPLLAPIFNDVDHMWPGLFPLGLLVPAVVFDLLNRTKLTTPARGWLAALALGALFLALLLAVQWPLSSFLLTPGARNSVFAADQWYYSVTHTLEGVDLPRLGEWRYQFWNLETDGLGLRALAWSLLAAVLASRLGLAWGSWLERLRR